MANKKIKLDGNDFHYQVKKTLEITGWKVRVSPHYNDAFSEKPREIDIIAEKAFSPAQNSVYTSVVIVRLFIECKYISEATTFWFEKKNMDNAKKVINATGLFYDPDKNYLVGEKHHYLSDTLVAKLYHTEGKSQDGDPIYKAMNQCLNATIYYRHHPTDLREKYDRHSLVELNYPVIACNSFENFIKKDTTDDSTSSIDQSFQWEIDYAYIIKDKEKEEMFYIDVLELEKFPEFENNILLPEIELARQKVSDDKREAEWQARMANSRRDDYDPFNFR